MTVCMLRTCPTSCGTAAARIVGAPWAARVAQHAPVDERPVVAEPSFGELIELD